jgi:hypothetical protein
MAPACDDRHVVPDEDMTYRGEVRGPTPLDRHFSE